MDIAEFTGRKPEILDQVITFNRLRVIRCPYQTDRKINREANTPNHERLCNGISRVVEQRLNRSLPRRRRPYLDFSLTNQQTLDN